VAADHASVLFAMPPGGQVPHFSEHIGTAFLRAVLAREGVSARQYLPEVNPTLRGFAATLAEQRPAVVGFTAYETNLRTCRAMIRTVRETLPEAVVLVGGPNATFTPEETLELLDADACVRGAAEATIPVLAKAILGSEAPRRRLPGLVSGVRNLVGRTGGQPWSTPVGDLSSFPGPPYRTLDDLPSPYQDGLVSRVETGYMTARGCNQHCTYCSFAAVSGRRIHFHGVERVLEDLAVLARLVAASDRHQPIVSILDDAFTIAPGRARAICEALIDRGLKLPLDCMTRADTVDGDLLRLMRRAGFVSIGFGLESAVPRVLRAVGKVRPPDAPDDPRHEAERQFLARVREAVEAARAAGLQPRVSIIGGLPGESADDLRQTLAFVDSLGVESYTHNLLRVFPGTPLHRDQARHGIASGRLPVTREWHTAHAFDPGAVEPLATAEVHLELRREALRVAAALCGGPGPDDTFESSVWAVVLHDVRAEPAVAAWLREVLIVGGTLLVIDGSGGRGPDLLSAWHEALWEAGVGWGHLEVLVEQRHRGHLALRSLGTLGSHRFALRDGPSAARPRVDRAGHWEVPIRIASASPAAPGVRPGASSNRGPLVADGCRWWPRGRRCAHPEVLHVAGDGGVRACWHGPPIGAVGDPVETLAALGRALRPRRTDSCPMGTAGDSGWGLTASAAWAIVARLRLEHSAGYATRRVRKGE
jgi:radical SAM superfamily enzyme YgiQ (UPF0313 family)